MTRRLVAVFVTLVLFSLPAVAQEDETDRRPVRIPTIEEVQAELDRVERRPRSVTINPDEARRAAHEILDSATDEEVVDLYRALFKAQNEHASMKRTLVELNQRVKENRARRDAARRHH